MYKVSDMPKWVDQWREECIELIVTCLNITILDKLKFSTHYTISLSADCQVSESSAVKQYLFHLHTHPLLSARQ